MKELVVRKILKWTSAYIPLTEAWCATLGGRGIEARLWQEAGIQPERGILIEKSTKLSRPLIADLSYEYYPRLESFATWWQRNRKGQSLDLLHLDLCGTLEPLLETVREIIPLVAKSRGRCLAVTVAEKRRNRSLETYDLVRAQMSHAVGAKLCERLETQLKEEHERLGVVLGAGPLTQPEKGMKREAGFVQCLLNLFTGSDAVAGMPDSIERYAYRSGYGRRPCRMRTVLLHLGEATPGPSAGQDLVVRWLASPLLVALGKGFESMPSHGSAQARRSRGRPRGTVKKQADPTLQAQLSLLRAEADGPEALQTALVAVTRELGLRGRTARTRRVLSGLRAEMFGRFRPSFVRAATQQCGEEILPQLATLYSKLRGVPVTVGELRQEAGLPS